MTSKNHKQHLLDNRRKRKQKAKNQRRRRRRSWSPRRTCLIWRGQYF